MCMGLLSIILVFAENNFYRSSATSYKGGLLSI